eukprot:CAMPEP_0114984964 /NCGR_PEP_ID=MMETSP0216-20121206/7584_1 /TAXON_ID=223996 /ORGANISM="Protocruzia adherens, Strain Boccale" /LENGTH=189 /DNA_ID=CAMNT_0002347189 /DNA_START=25 /DNA_END=594 /DNA_ORIENTATION=-
MSELGEVKAVLILDSDGKRIYAKYYTSILGTFREQHDFEKTLSSRLGKMGSSRQSDIDIMTANNFVVVFKNFGDFILFVVGDQNENELILSNVCDCVVEAVEIITKRRNEKRRLLEKLDLLMLLIDEMLDNGVILSMDANDIVGRIKMKEGDGAEGAPGGSTSSSSSGSRSFADRLREVRAQVAGSLNR